MSDELKEIADNFRKGMQEISNESGCTISAGVSGEEMRIISEPENEKKGIEPSMELKLPPMHLACLADECRPNTALIEIKNGVASATNAHIIVRIDLLKQGHLSKEQIKFIEGRHIHMETWKEMHKCDMLQIDDDGLHISNKGITKNIDFSSPVGEFFNIQSVIDEVKKAGEIETKYLSLDVSFFDVIRKIFGTSRLVFSFSGPSKAVIITPADESMDYAWAMAMPSMLMGGITRYFI